MREQGEFRGGSAVLTPGKHVRSADGKQLGTLSEVEGSYFKVHAMLRHDYWLSAADVAAAQGSVVVVDFKKSVLNDHKLAEPGLEPADDPFKDVEIAPLIQGDDELMDQRARMEREMAEQSKRLPPEERHAPPEDPTIPPDSIAFRSLAGESVPYAGEERASDPGLHENPNGGTPR